MNNSFEASYKNDGILSKKLFLESQITKNFIDWIIPFINGGKNLEDIGYKYESMIHTIKNYEWRKESFSDTFQRFEGYRKGFKTSNDQHWKETCVEILKWGGVIRSNKTKITMMKSLIEFLLNMNKIIDKDEIIIKDLDPYYISSGFTKIYAASNENFIMYDGRVGSALCFLIKNFLLQTKRNTLPSELIFGYGAGRGKQNRNPNDKSSAIRFTNITSNRTIHFVSNIKANWLLKAISEKVEMHDFESDSEKVFALQTALFVLGEEIP